MASLNTVLQSDRSAEALARFVGVLRPARVGAGVLPFFQRTGVESSVVEDLGEINEVLKGKERPNVLARRQHFFLGFICLYGTVLRWSALRRYSLAMEKFSDNIPLTGVLSEFEYEGS